LIQILHKLTFEQFRKLTYGKAGPDRKLIHVTCRSDVVETATSEIEFKLRDQDFIT